MAGAGRVGEFSSETDHLEASVEEEGSMWRLMIDMTQYLMMGKSWLEDAMLMALMDEVRTQFAEFESES